MTKSKKERQALFQKFSSTVTEANGNTYAFVGAVSSILLWQCSGPFFNYSGVWPLINNTSTTIITFLMIFIIQKTQNKESLSIQLKLNELLAANEIVGNRLVRV